MAFQRAVNEESTDAQTPDEEQGSQIQPAEGLASEGMPMLDILNCESSVDFRRVAISRATFGRICRYRPSRQIRGLLTTTIASFQEKPHHL
jgi:hypothetical protein